MPDAARPGQPAPVDARVPLPPDAALPACTDVPACLQKLALGCPTTGACVVSRNGQITTQCYTATMVKVATSVSGQGVGAKVFGPDGKLCYTLVVTQARGGMGGQGAMVVYSDINGQPIASGNIQGAGRVTLACSAGGAPALVTLACAPGAGALAGLAGIGGTNGCTNGPCTP
jgi:hypothetical protein